MFIRQSTTSMSAHKNGYSRMHAAVGARRFCWRLLARGRGSLSRSEADNHVSGSYYST